MTTRSAIAALLAVSALALSLLWLIGGSVHTPLVSETETASTSPYTRPSLPDSDGDGLKDWEELLWGTDIHNPDSDGDGMNDGDEVNAARNPKEAGDMSLVSPLDRARSLIRSLNTGRNEPLLSPNPGELATSTVLVSSNFKTIDTNDLNVIRAYGETLALSLKPLGSAPVAQAASTTFGMIQSNTYQNLSSLTKLERDLISVGNTLLAQTVPLSAVELHAELTTDIFKLAELSYYMQHVESEPLLALSGAQEYELIRAHLYNTSMRINKYFREHNILFHPLESATIEL